MIFSGKIGAFLIFCVFMAYSKPDCIVRVLLHRGTTHNQYMWTIRSKYGFIFTDPRAPRKNIHYKKKILLIHIKNGNIYIDQMRYQHDQLYIRPVRGLLQYDDHEYGGTLLIAKKNTFMHLINCLPLEQYLYGVLKTESWPGWPLEVNKVFAVACRTYVIEKMHEARRAKRIYHVCNTNAHQTYKGHHSSSYLKRAVQDTQGLFLTYNNRPIIAMFDSCCGGIVPAHITGIDFEKAPYLQRAYACSHCRVCSIYSWKCTIDLNTIEQKLGPARCKKIKKITNIRIVKKDKAGLVQELEICGVGGKIPVSGKEFYSWFKGINSFFYTISRKGNNLICSGRGFGHHVGLCQWGAREMVRNGWDYRSILQFYYPGTTFVKLR